MTDNDLKYKIGISLIPNVGPVVAKKLIAYLGSVEAVFKEKKSRLLRIHGIGETIAESVILQDVLSRAEAELEYISANDISVFFYLDNDYPERLKQCDDAPVILFARGNTDFNVQKSISIIGTRKATPAGKEICRNFIRELSEKGYQVLIVSGLAYGIDITAHKAALENKFHTVAVLGHGLDTIYPQFHSKVAAEIVRQGALVTDYLSGTLPDRQNFVKRNRIIAGLTDATIVVETGLKGGSLITAELASSYYRDVFAFPGRINDPLSSGCNNLIKTNKAALIETVSDLEDYLGWNNQLRNGQAVQQKLFKELDHDEQTVMDILKQNGELEIDNIAYLTNLPPGRVSAVLLNLEFSGLISCMPGKIFAIR